MKRWIVVLLAAPVVLAGCSYSEYNRWVKRCIDMNGIVLETEKGFWSDRYECFVDGDLVTVPGYEGE